MNETVVKFQRLYRKKRIETFLIKFKRFFSDLYNLRMRYEYYDSGRLYNDPAIEKLCSEFTKRMNVFIGDMCFNITGNEFLTAYIIVNYRDYFLNNTQSADDLYECAYLLTDSINSFRTKDNNAFRRLIKGYVCYANCFTVNLVHKDVYQSIKKLENIIKIDNTLKYIDSDVFTESQREEIRNGFNNNREILKRSLNYSDEDISSIINKIIEITPIESNDELFNQASRYGLEDRTYESVFKTLVDLSLPIETKTLISRWDRIQDKHGLDAFNFLAKKFNNLRKKRFEVHIFELEKNKRNNIDSTKK